MAEQRRNTRTTRTATKAKPVDEYGHLQPQALDFEEAVLGAFCRSFILYMEVVSKHLIFAHEDCDFRQSLSIQIFIDGRKEVVQVVTDK